MKIDPKEIKETIGKRNNIESKLVCCAKCKRWHKGKFDNLGLCQLHKKITKKTSFCKGFKY